MRPLIVLAPVVGLAAGGVSRAVAAPTSASRAAIALIAVFGAASCLAAAAAIDDARPARRLVRAGAVAAAAFAAAWIATTVAGEPGFVGACAVVAAAALLAAGAASLVRASGGAAHATFAGAAVPAVLAGAVFVADPFVEWNGSTTAAAPDRTAAVLCVNPIGSIAADAGVDWQHSRWMYEGPFPGASGLSAAMRYYPARGTPPWAWAIAAAVVGAAACAAARPRSSMSP